MRQKSPVLRGRKGRESGFVLITMAMASIAMLGILGVAVDIGRMFIAKNETQAYCDSAALAAALALDGTSTGISLAKTAVTNSANTWNLDTSKVTNPTVTFATSASGPWVSNPSPATAYTYASVSATVPLTLYFLPVVVGNTTQNVTSAAVAAQVAITSFPQGLAPYSAVSTVNTPPNFGLVVGNSYDIQWPASNAGGFVTSPCSGDSLTSQQAVLNNWGSTSGYWGASSNNVIQQEILDAIQTEPLSIGTNIQPVLTNGQKQSEAGYLDDRVNQDISTDLSNTPSGYMSSTHNGRRLLPVPVIDPTSTSNTTVIGYASFLLLANKIPSDYYKKNTNGNSAFCAIYAGPYQVGGISTGPGGSTGATFVKLIQ